MIESLRAKTLLVAGIVLLGSSSSWAAFVTWSLNPNNQNGPANQGGLHTVNFTVSGATISARGFDTVSIGNSDLPHDLVYKYENPIGGAIESGLGLANVPDSELFSNPNGSPANYIQLDLTSILAQGFTNGQLSVGSVQAGESFRLFGSNSVGNLGTQIGGVFGSQFDGNFVDIANFGSFKLISIAAGTGDVLPVAFRAIAPVPEVSSFLPLVGVVAAVGSTHILRRRRMARASV